MSEQFLRAFSLIVADENNNGEALSDLHVKFIVHKAVVGTPQYVTARVYNLAPETAKQIQKEFTKVQLQAGYQGNIATIFEGTIRQIKIGRENGTDTYLDILACDGDAMHNYSVTNTTIPSGWAQADLLQRLNLDTVNYGISPGFTPQFNGPKMPRAKVCYGMTKDYLHSLADSSGTDWFIENGQLNFLPIGAALPDTVVSAVVVNANSGMIGSPRQTLNGIELRVLINPLIRCGGLLQLDNASIQTIQLDPSFGSSSATNNIFFDENTGKNTGLDADGLYKVYSINMSGDTRGQDWYFDIICIGLNATGPISSPFTNAVVSSIGF